MLSILLQYGKTYVGLFEDFQSFERLRLMNEQQRNIKGISVLKRRSAVYLI